ncbi:hypothetical protein BCR33DRAFT_711595 [Rhizoclosmatium globosum]|uniref:Uncharacterized protein n=1 Tax=Rhizoclosmatium globosum TaxID=329046 RepID=A0A1Y2D3W2_9FUNG|nr:hypothetical protein BCR33DRAFT_711595 [Rhizoclosmatium globosum]|eukprot:ORY53265.1 hypothetical protein BCR33DRAFT_711595 [Rhizoclosmatium globosum]
MEQRDVPINNRDANFHTDAQKAKDESLLAALASPKPIAIPLFLQRWSNRLYAEPFLRGLLSFLEDQHKSPSNIYDWKILKEVLTESEPDYIIDVVGLLLGTLKLTESLDPEAGTISFCWGDHLPSGSLKTWIRELRRHKWVHKTRAVGQIDIKGTRVLPVQEARFWRRFKCSIL